jgi:uncharacterized protein
MELEKRLTVPATPEQVWALLLDPQVMGQCVPGMQAIEVLSDTEYLAQMQVKLAFINAKFKIHTTVVEQRAPHYLRSVGTGDDASVASSFKQVSEIELERTEAGHTALRMAIRVDLLGRLGSFGMNVMKTKSDRLWEEFGRNLMARAVASAPPTAALAAPTAPVRDAGTVAVHDPQAQAASTQRPAIASLPFTARHGIPVRAGWWRRLFAPAAAGPGAQRLPNDICIEVRRGDATVTVLWPAQDGAECAAWLRDYLK